MKKIAIIADCDFRTKPNGGVVQLLNNFLKANECSANEYFLLGMSFSENEKVGEWQKITIGKNSYNFFPIAQVLKDKEKTKIPFRLRCVLGLYKYKKEIIKKEIEVAYIHSPELGIPLFKMKTLSFVYHIHGDPNITLRYSRFLVFRGDFFVRIYKRVISTAIKKSKLIIWAAEQPYKLYCKAQPEMKNIIDTKSTVIHSSFDDSMIMGEPDPRIDTKKKHLISVGRIAKIKRIDFILQALKQVISDGYNVDLLICGEGEEQDNIKQLAHDISIQDSVVFLGNVTHEKLATILGSSELFVFASENEAMSLVVIESLYMGTPVVSTDVGDVKFAVKNNYTGYIINGYNLDEYKNAIETVLDRGRDYYKNNCIKMAGNFTPQIMAEKINDELGRV